MLEYLGALWTREPIRGDGYEGYGRIVKGVLTNSNSEAYADKKVRVFVKDWFGIPYYVGKGKTDKNGYFKIKYRWTSGMFSFNYRVVVAVVERIPFSESLKFAKQTISCETIERKASVQQSKIDIGIHKLSVNFRGAASYSKEERVERLSPAQIKVLTQVQKPSRIPSPDYLKRFLVAVFPPMIKRVFANFPGLSAQTAQKIFDTLSQPYERYPNTPEALIDCLLNTVCAVPYKKEGDEVSWTANWDVGPLTGERVDFDKEDSLPNVKVTAVIIDEKVVCQSIEIQFRKEASQKIDPDKVSKNQLEWACYIAKSVFALKGEIEEHLAKGHLLVGIDAEKFFKYIKPENPIFKALAPHLLMVDFINWAGSLGIIFDEGSVLEALTALMGKSLGEFFVSGIVDRANYLAEEDELVQPSLSDDHHKAKAEKAHLKVLQKYVEEFIEKNEEEIEKYWKEIYQWSKSVNKSCPAIPKITKSKTTPSEQDFERLKARMVRLLFLATIGHGIIHGSQAVLMNIFSASLGLEKKALKEKNFAHDGNTKTSQAAYQLFIAHALMRFNTNKLIDNREGNIDPDLLKIIDEHRKEYPKGVRERIPQYVEI